MATNQVPAFLPSTHGFAFSNSWPRTPARRWNLGLVEIGKDERLRGAT